MVATDGSCGALKYLLVDPSVPRVVHLVVEPEHRIGLGRLVPVELISAVEQDAHDVIDLGCDLASFEALPLAESSEVVPGVGTGYVYFGRNLGSPAPRVEVHGSFPEGEAPLTAGEPVLATDGEIGKLAGFDVEPPDHRIVGVVVDKERFPWGHRRMVLPVNCVAKFKPDVELSLSTAELFAMAAGENRPGRTS